MGLCWIELQYTVTFDEAGTATTSLTPEDVVIFGGILLICFIGGLVVYRGRASSGGLEVTQATLDLEQATILGPPRKPLFMDRL